MADDTGGPSGFRVTAEVADDGRVVAELIGELDLGTVPVFVQRMDELLDERPELIELDLGQLTFIDSSGVGAYVNAVRRAHAAGARVLIGARSPVVDRVLQLSGVEEALTAEAPEG